MYLGGALRRTPFFAIRRPGRNAYFYRLAGIVFGVGGRGTGWRESFFCWWAGESSRGTAKTPPLQSGNAAMAMIGTATNGHALWPYAANGVPSRGNRGRWAWMGWRESFLGWWAGESSRGTAKTPPLQSGADAAIAMIGIATNGHALWPYAASGVPSRGNRGRWAWTIQNDAGGTPSACRGMTTGGRAPTSSPYVRRGGCISSGRCGRG